MLLHYDFNRCTFQTHANLTICDKELISSMLNSRIEGVDVSKKANLALVCNLQLLSYVLSKREPTQASFTSKPMTSQNTPIFSIPINRKTMSLHQIYLHNDTMPVFDSVNRKFLWMKFHKNKSARIMCNKKIMFTYSNAC